MLTRSFNRGMAFVYGGQPVEVRVQGEATVDFTSPGGAITRTYSSKTINALVGAETKAKEGHTREFTFLTAEYPQDPPSSTNRLVFEDLIYEVVDFSTDSVVFRIFARRP